MSIQVKNIEKHLVLQAVVKLPYYGLLQVWNLPMADRFYLKVKTQPISMCVNVRLDLYSSIMPCSVT
jgi:hypothetical protein